MVCPTCEQNIEEEFRLNKIEDSKTKAQELQSGLEKLETVIESEMARESKFKKISGDITNNLNEISKNKRVVLSEDLQKKLIHGYYASTSFIDAQIKIVLDSSVHELNCVNEASEFLIG